MDSFVDLERKAATPAARPRSRKASACSGKSTIKFNRANKKRYFSHFIMSKIVHCYYTTCLTMLCQGIFLDFFLQSCCIMCAIMINYNSVFSIY
ncbi:MAG: hypothetical protein ACE3JN_17840 [Ectobacillus sp.]